MEASMPARSSVPLVLCAICPRRVPGTAQWRAPCLLGSQRAAAASGLRPKERAVRIAAELQSGGAHGHGAAAASGLRTKHRGRTRTKERAVRLAKRELYLADKGDDPEEAEVGRAARVEKRGRGGLSTVGHN
eukprot:1309702-Prymnesium_polylepis.1